jgi:hypothetical protein
MSYSEISTQIGTESSHDGFDASKSDESEEGKLVALSIADRCRHSADRWKSIGISVKISE